MRASRHARPASQRPSEGFEEKRYGKTYDARVIRRLWPFITPYRCGLAGAAVCMLGSALSALAAPYLIKLSLDQAIAHGSLAALTFYVLLFIGNALLGWGLQYSETLLLTHTAQKVLYDLRRTLVQHVLRLDLAFYDRQAVGRLMSRIQNDVGTLQDLFTSGILSMLGDVLTLLGIVLVLASMHWRLTLYTCAVVPLVLVLTFYWRSRSRVAFHHVRAALARVNAALQENIAGVRVIQSLVSEALNLQRFEKLNDTHLQATLHAARLAAVFFPTIEMVSILGIALVVALGGPMVLAGSLSAGGLVAFVLYMQRFFEPLRDLSFRWNGLQMAMASGERILEVLDTPARIVDPLQPRRLLPPRGEITFDHVSFQYHPGIPVLHDLCLHVPAGQRLAIVGHTGAGKTTFINLLLRFYDVTAGAVLLDGVDIRQLSLHELRSHIGLVLQEPFLFSGTVRENLRYGNPAATEDTIVAAARALGVDDLIRRLPRGYDTDVHERGSGLSQGQRQLLGFVRALLADPRIVILDEATASIDAETEHLVQEGLATLCAGRTVFIIAHRLATVRHADRIIVLDHGCLVESGTHEALLQQNGPYARLYTMAYAEVTSENLLQ